MQNASMQNAYVSNIVDPTSEERKEVKILGKKLSTGIITTTEEGDVKVVDEKPKFVSKIIFSLFYNCFLNNKPFNYQLTSIINL